MSRFTDKEIAIFKGSRDNEYANVFEEGFVWTFAIIENSGLDPKVARGAIASLVKKGIVEITDYDNDTCFGYTPEGKVAAFEALALEK